MIAPDTGVLLNNEMDDFALLPGIPNAFGVTGYDANALQPGKRMLSSMSPVFMISKDKTAIVGTPGGSRIITMMLLSILGYDDGLDAAQVAALPCYHHQWRPDSIDMESGALSAQTVSALRALWATPLIFMTRRRMGKAPAICGAISRQCCGTGIRAHCRQPVTHAMRLAKAWFYLRTDKHRNKMLPGKTGGKRKQG